MTPSSWMSSIPGFSTASSHSHGRSFGGMKKPPTLEEEMRNLELIKFQMESEPKVKPPSVPMMEHLVGDDEESGMGTSLNAPQEEEEDDEYPYKDACRAGGVDKGNNDNVCDMDSLFSFADE
ncbi:expressed unknown protein [Seminavis robusta]|uniref:Uncharacterized protein n=1 Tax=Seminavis robusta TaxID=568900 RepID=A0A9N8DLB6_9STRA|nr:expressed unknown protein [Seminavis robusta]|eukprot:Sro221_g090930.1 n/a (122) ;mRNA; r:24231-24596